MKIFRKKNVQKNILIAVAIVIIPMFVLFGAGDLGTKKIAVIP